VAVTISHQLDRPPPSPPQSRTAGSAASSFFRLRAIAWAMAPMTPKRHGHHRHAPLRRGLMKDLRRPLLVILCCHLAMAGRHHGRRLAHHQDHGQRITKLTPVRRFAAETAGALTLMATAHFGIPGQHHAHHHRRHRGCRRTRPPFRRPAGALLAASCRLECSPFPGAALFGATLFNSSATCSRKVRLLRRAASPPAVTFSSAL